MDLEADELREWLHGYVPGWLGPGETECSVCRGADSFVFFEGDGPEDVNADDADDAGTLELELKLELELEFEPDGGNENDDVVEEEGRTGRGNVCICVG